MDWEHSLQRALSPPTNLPCNLFGHVPKYLQPGDTIAITCPGGALDGTDIYNCKAALERWGFKTRIGKTVGSHWQRFRGTDDDRAAGLQDLPR